MALVKCEVCGRDISDKAKKCPHCGAERIAPQEEPLTKICPECGASIPIDVEECPNCGCPVDEEKIDPNKSQEPQKVEISKISVNKNTKKIIVMAGVAVIILAAIIGIASIAKSAKAKKEAAAAEQAYADSLNSYKGNLELARATMLSGAAEAESAAGLIHDVWYNAIYKKSDSKTNKYTKPYGSFVSDFNKALSNLFSDSSFTSKTASIKLNKITVDNLMKKLVNPPEEYKEAYSAVRDLYEVYSDLCNCATNPSGNLQSFTSTFNTADSDFMKYYNALGFYID